MESTNAEQFIFCLTPSGKAPKWLLSLAGKFSDYGIKLVPVRLDQLKILSGTSGKIHVLFIETNFREKKWLSRCLSGFLGFAIKSKAATFYHVSSFSPMGIYLGNSKNKSYQHFSLPIKSQTLVNSIAKIFWESKEESSRWPGGRSPRLSSSVVE